MATKKKHTRLELRWNKKLGGWALHEGGRLIVEYQPTISKATAEQHARGYARKTAPSKLLIKTKAGEIGTGGRYEASYGCDSRKKG